MHLHHMKWIFRFFFHKLQNCIYSPFIKYIFNVKIMIIMLNNITKQKRKQYVKITQ